MTFSSTMQPDISIGIYEFEFQLLDSMRFNKMPGSLWHGVFGDLLHQQSCVYTEQECDRCLLLHQCDYPYLFKRIAPPDSDVMAGKQVPSPHVFQFDGWFSKILNKGEGFRFKLVLIGQANEKISEIVRAVFFAGMRGLGKEMNRFQLLKVSQLIAEGNRVLIMEENQMVSDPKPMMPELPEPPATACLNFKAPYKPNGNQSLVTLNASYLVMAIVRRISLLQYFYTEKRLDADFPQIKTKTEQIKIVVSHEKGRSKARALARHGRADANDWMGTIELDIQSAPELWPYLWLGQYLNVGKKASMGYGQYSLG